jgi:hypothetical protein
VECPAVASNAAGDTVVARQRGALVQAVSSRRGSTSWSAAVDVSEGHCQHVALTGSGDAILVYTKRR